MTTLLPTRRGQWRERAARTPLLEDRRGDEDRADIGLDLVDAGEIVENPRPQLPGRDGLGRVLRRVSLISGGGRKVEQAGREPGLVEAVEDDRQADAVRADARVFRFPLEAVLAVRRQADALVAARRDSTSDWRSTANSSVRA